VFSLVIKTFIKGKKKLLPLHPYFLYAMFLTDEEKLLICFFILEF